MTAKETLDAARSVRPSIERRKAELYRVEDLTEYVGSTSMLQDLYDALRWEIERLMRIQAAAIAIISRIQDEKIRSALWVYYIDGATSWDEAAKKLYISRPSFARLLRKAKKELEKCV